MNTDELRKIDFQVSLKQMRIIFPNFTGAPDNYNPVGNRNFCLELDDSDANYLTSLGLNVRSTKADSHFLKVKLPAGFEDVAYLDKDTPEFVDVDLYLAPWSYERLDGVMVYLMKIAPST